MLISLEFGLVMDYFFQSKLIFRQNLLDLSIILTQALKQWATKHDTSHLPLALALFPLQHFADKYLGIRARIDVNHIDLNVVGKAESLEFVIKGFSDLH